MPRCKIHGQTVTPEHHEMRPRPRLYSSGEYASRCRHAGRGHPRLIHRAGRGRLPNDRCVTEPVAARGGRHNTETYH